MLKVGCLRINYSLFVLCIDAFSRMSCDEVKQNLNLNSDDTIGTNGISWSNLINALCAFRLHLIAVWLLRDNFQKCIKFT